MSTKRLNSLITLALLSGCASLHNLKKYDTIKPPDIHSAAVISVSALPAVPFNSVSDDLKPKDPAKSANDYRLLAIEKALSVIESRRSTSSLGVQANLIGIDKAKTFTENRSLSSEGEVRESSELSSTRTFESGERPEDLATGLELPGLNLLLSDFSSGLDLELAMEAADYLYQRAKLNDAYFDIDLTVPNHDLWVLRLNVDVQPLVRKMPYDVRSVITIGDIHENTEEIRLVPLFATGNYESANVTNLISSLAQLNANISAVTGGNGLGAGYERQLDRLLETVGTDINTKISVAVAGKNKLAVSLPASYSPKSEYELRDQNYKITLLAYVKKSQECNALRELPITNQWLMRDAQTGSLVGNTGSETQDTSIILPNRSLYKLPQNQTLQFIDDGNKSISISVVDVKLPPGTPPSMGLVKYAKKISNYSNAINSIIDYKNEGISEEISYLYEPTSYGITENGLTAKFPSIAASGDNSTDNLFLYMGINNACDGNSFKEVSTRLYPLQKNVKASGKIDVIKPKFTSGLVSKKVSKTQLSDEKAKVAKAIIYVQGDLKKAPSDHFLIKVSNATIPGTNPNISMLGGSLIKRTLNNQISNGFVVTLNSAAEIVLRDITSSNVQIEIIPWDVKAQKAKSADQSQSHTLEISE